MTIDALRSRRASWWAWGLGASLALGAAMALSMEVALGTVVVLLGIVAFARSRHPAESLVALYWVAFTAYDIVFYGLIIRFGFYPFYLVFFASFVLALFRDGVRVDRTLAWLYAGFMVTVLASFLGFVESIDSAVIQRLLGFLVGAAVLLQFRSRGGLRPVTVAAVVASLVVSGYTVYRSVQSGFGYRGDLEANPNSAAMLVALGAVVAVAMLIELSSDRRRRAALPAMIVVLGLMLYSVLLLASRGLAISLVVSFTVMIGRAMLRDWRRVTLVIAIVALAGTALLLPGGQNLVERFTSPEEELTSAGSRIPIWEVTIENIMAGNVRELLFGHGFDASQAVVERRFAGQPSTHNAYLQILYEFGLLSLVFFVGMLGYVAWRSLSLSGAYGSIMLGLTTLLVIENLTGDVHNGYPFWIAMGYLGAISTWAERPG